MIYRYCAFSSAERGLYVIFLFLCVSIVWLFCFVLPDWISELCLCCAWLRWHYFCLNFVWRRETHIGNTYSYLLSCVRRSVIAIKLEKLRDACAHVTDKLNQLITSIIYRSTTLCSQNVHLFISWITPSKINRFLMIFGTLYREKIWHKKSYRSVHLTCQL